MVKKSIVQSNLRKKYMIEKYRSIRQEIKLNIKKSRFDKSINVFQEALKLDRLNINSSYIRYRKRCVLTGRSRGLVSYNYFGLCGYQLRMFANMGFINGLSKDC